MAFDKNNHCRFYPKRDERKVLHARVVSLDDLTFGSRP